MKMRNSNIEERGTRIRDEGEVREVVTEGK
jgi:hypothetical protein